MIGDDTRGQAHTLEAFTAALILVTAVIFAIEVTAVTPLSASTSNQHIETQQQDVADDLLAAIQRDGTLREATVYWNTSREGEGAFNGTASGVCGNIRCGYAGTDQMPDDMPIRPALRDTLDERQLAYNIEVTYRNTTALDDVETIDMVDMGTPSDNAATATRTVYLYNRTSLTGPDDRMLYELDENEFYAPDINEESQLYNVLEVRIVVWRL